MRLVSSSASQSGFQAHFFHHLLIYSPRHCCHQSTPEGTRHTASEEANQPKVLQQKTNSNPLLSTSSILNPHHLLHGTAQHVFQLRFRSASERSRLKLHSTFRKNPKHCAITGHPLKKEGEGYAKITKDRESHYSLTKKMSRSNCFNMLQENGLSLFECSFLYTKITVL